MLADLVDMETERPFAAARGAAVPVAVPRASIKRAGKLISRRQLLSAVCQFGAIGATGTYGTQVEPFWVQWHDYSMPLRNLPASFDRFRMMQLTDLHAGADVPMSYLKSVIDKAVRARPDLVVVTGDFVTHTAEYVAPICDALGALPAAGIQTLATFGNHDYKHGDDNYAPGPMLSEILERRLTRNGIAVLRNRAIAITRGGRRLWLVGLEDLWSGLFSPAVAFAGVPLHEPIIALSHNPDTAEELDAYGTQWILSGHTHGGQVRVPGIGSLLVNVQNQQYQLGEYALPHSKLYISRGVGYLKRIRLLCRPEVPTFVLQPAVV